MMNKENFLYRPDIDGLRALAVLLVVGFHAFPSLLPGGFIGVDLFFVISGFVIGLTVLNDIEKYNTKYKTSFIVKRFLRIAPLYYLTIIFFLLFVKTDSLFEILYNQKINLLLHFIFLHNLNINYQFPVYYSTQLFNLINKK